MEITAGWQRARPADDAFDEAAVAAQTRADPARFAPLYARYFPRVYRYCLRRVASPTEAEDLTSAIFTSALAGLAGYRGGSFAAWLFQIAHHTVISHRRTGTAAHATLLALVASAPRAPDAEEEAMARLVAVEQHTLLARAIATLSEEQQELLALKLSGRLTAREIGAVLGKSEGAVRVALHRLIQQLRVACHDAGEGER